MTTLQERQYGVTDARTIALSPQGHSGSSSAHAAVPNRPLCALLAAAPGHQARPKARQAPCQLFPATASLPSSKSGGAA